MELEEDDVHKSVELAANCFKSACYLETKALVKAPRSLPNTNLNTLFLALCFSK